MESSCSFCQSPNGPLLLLLEFQQISLIALSPRGHRFVFLSGGFFVGSGAFLSYFLYKRGVLKVFSTPPRTTIFFPPETFPIPHLFLIHKPSVEWVQFAVGAKPGFIFYYFLMFPQLLALWMLFFHEAALPFNGPQNRCRGLIFLPRPGVDKSIFAAGGIAY